MQTTQTSTPGGQKGKFVPTKTEPVAFDDRGVEQPGRPDGARDRGCFPEPTQGSSVVTHPRSSFVVRRPGWALFTGPAGPGPRRIRAMSELEDRSEERRVGKERR